MQHRLLPELPQPQDFQRHRWHQECQLRQSLQACLECLACLLHQSPVCLLHQDFPGKLLLLYQHLEYRQHPSHLGQLLQCQEHPSLLEQYLECQEFLLRLGHQVHLGHHPVLCRRAHPRHRARL